MALPMTPEPITAAVLMPSDMLSPYSFDDRFTLADPDAQPGLRLLRPFARISFAAALQ
jgi:hypothetical protein